MQSAIKISKVKKIWGYKFKLTMPDGEERWFTRRTMPNGGKSFEMRGAMDGTVFMYQKVEEGLSLEGVERIFQDYMNAGHTESTENLIKEVKSLMYELKLQLAGEEYITLCEELKTFVRGHQDG